MPGLVSKRPVVELASGGQAEIELPMRRCSILTGRVLSPGGARIADRRIWLVPPGSNHWGVSSFPVFTDAAGGYFSYIPYRGKDRFGLVCPDVGYAPLTDVTLVAGEKTRLDFRLRSGASIEGQVLKADRRTPANGAQVTLGGEDPIVCQPPREYPWAYLKENPPLEIGELGVFSSLTSMSRSSGSRARHIGIACPGVETDTEGRFRVELLPAGRYTLRAALDDRESAETVLTLRDGVHRTGLRLILDRPRDVPVFEWGESRNHSTPYNESRG